MVSKYPEMERGESVSQTGCDYAQAVAILDSIPQEVLEQYAPEQPAERRKYNERE